MLAGGKVYTLELSPVYGADILKNFLPFISPGSEYAGQLTDFDTGGSDMVYLLTVFFPYILTVLVGVPLLRSAASKSSSTGVAGCIWFGAALPVAYAPFISVAGDYYEMGSILVTRLVSFIFRDFQVHRWRSDDLFRIAGDLFFSSDTYKAADIAGVSFSLLTGIILVFGTYRAGVLWAGMISGKD
jgi:hypothetical protein